MIDRRKGLAAVALTGVAGAQACRPSLPEDGPPEKERAGRLAQAHPHELGEEDAQASI